MLVQRDFARCQSYLTEQREAANTILPFRLRAQGGYAGVMWASRTVYDALEGRN